MPPSRLGAGSQGDRSDLFGLISPSSPVEAAAPHGAGWAGARGGACRLGDSGCREPRTLTSSREKFGTALGPCDAQDATYLRQGPAAPRVPWKAAAAKAQCREGCQEAARIRRWALP